MKKEKVTYLVKVSGKIDYFDNQVLSHDIDVYDVDT